MYKVTKLILIFSILIFLSIPSAFAVSKSQSKYTGDALMSSQSSNIGFNLHWAQKCNFSGVFSIGNEVAILSWEDYKLYNSGWSGMINSSSSGCTLDAKDQILNEKKYYLAELKNKVNQQLGKLTSTQESLSDSSSNINNYNEEFFKNIIERIDFYPINEEEVKLFLNKFNINFDFPRINEDTELYLEGSKYEKGGSHGVNYAKAHEFYEKDLKLNGNLKSVFFTSLGYWYGDGVPINYKKSLFLSLIGVEFEESFYANYSRAALSFRRLGEINKAIQYLEHSHKIKP